MGIYDWVWRGARTALCAGGLAAGVVAMTPGVAAAACKQDVTASGSTLQTSQEQHWNTTWKGEGCGTLITAEILYNNGPLGGTGSGQGLEEFGMPGKELLAGLSSIETELDGFVGTDDPPNSELLTEGKEASESQVLTVPVVAAPIALIFHLPVACTFVLAKWNLTKAIVNEIWLGDINWEELLLKLGAANIVGCTESIKHEVRSDSSGTSFAFKWWLCQIESAAEVEKVSQTTCTTWLPFLSDASSWPALTGELKEHFKSPSPTLKLNKGTGEEINAVGEEQAATGYANFANVETEGGFSKYSQATTLQTTTLFWAPLETKANEFTEPGPGSKPGNCPTTLNATQEAQLANINAATPNWEGFHLSFIKEGELYPLCTLTYAVTWENFLTTILTGPKGYLSAVLAEETANTVKEFLLWATKEVIDGGLNIVNGYHTAPQAVLEKAEEILLRIKT
jgi:ABC-type phosphate transport system substrate-binding protein